MANVATQAAQPKDLALGSKQEQLVNYLSTQITGALQQRASMERSWRQYFKNWMAGNKRVWKPFSGASDIDIPVTATFEMAVSARLQNTILQPEYPIAIAPKNGDDATTHLALALERQQNLAAETEWGHPAFLATLTRDLAIFGTAISKQVLVDPGDKQVIVWKDLLTKTVTPVGEGDHTAMQTEQQLGVTKAPRTGKPVPSVTAIPIQDFIIPTGTLDLDRAPWVCHRFVLTPQEFRRAVKAGTYKYSEEVTNDHPVQMDNLSKEQALAAGVKPKREGYYLFEIWLAPMPEYGVTEPAVITLLGDGPSTISKTVLRAITNPYFHQRYPFVRHIYEERRGSFYGIGVAEQVAPFQKVISTIMAQDLDSATKANIVLPLVNSMSPAARRKLDLGNLKAIPTTDPSKDVNFVKFPEPFTRLPQLAALVLSWAERRVGLGAYSRGEEQIKRPTASGQIRLIEESNQPLYARIRCLRTSLSKVYTQVLLLYQQAYPGGISVYVPQVGQTVEVPFPRQPIEELVRATPRASVATMNREDRRDQMVGILDRAGQSFGFLLQLASSLGPDVATPMSVSVMQAYTKLLERTFDLFDVGGIEHVIPQTDKIVQLKPIIERLVQQQAQQLAQKMAPQFAQQMLQQQGVPQQGLPPQGMPPQGMPPQGGMQ